MDFWKAAGCFFTLKRNKGERRGIWRSTIKNKIGSSTSLETKLVVV